MRNIWYGAVIKLGKDEFALATIDGAVYVVFEPEENEFFWRSVLVDSVPIDKDGMLRTTPLRAAYRQNFDNYEKWKVLARRYPELRRISHSEVSRLYGQDIWNS